MAARLPTGSCAPSPRLSQECRHSRPTDRSKAVGGRSSLTEASRPGSHTPSGDTRPYLVSCREPGVHTGDPCLSPARVRSGSMWRRPTRSRPCLSPSFPLRDDADPVAMNLTRVRAERGKNEAPMMPLLPISWQNSSLQASSPCLSASLPCCLQGVSRAPPSTPAVVASCECHICSRWASHPPPEFPGPPCTCRPVSTTALVELAVTLCGCV